MMLSDRISLVLKQDLFSFLCCWIDSVTSLTPHSNSTTVDFIIRKNSDRIKLFSSSLQGIYFSQVLEFLGLPSLEITQSRLIGRLQKSSHYINSFPSALSWRLCLSNILHSHNQFFLIDPRGTSFDSPNLNILYEFAKLRHSFVDPYDLFNSGDISFIYNSEGSFEFHPCKSPSTSRQHISDIYFSMLNRYQLDDQIIKVIESSLFLSMLPLHAESPSKLLRFYTLYSASSHNLSQIVWAAYSFLRVHAFVFCVMSIVWPTPNVYIPMISFLQSFNSSVLKSITLLFFVLSNCMLDFCFHLIESLLIWCFLLSSSLLAPLLLSVSWYNISCNCSNNQLFFQCYIYCRSVRWQ